MGRLDGKVALISGAARGMGNAEAKLFAAEGAKVVVADIIDDEGQALAAEIGDAAIYQHLDVAQEEQWQSAVKAAGDAFGPVNVLVNNAGTVIPSPMRDLSLEHYQKVIDVNQTGVFLGMKSVTPAMEAAGGGSIVNISSIDGMIGMDLVFSYVASKWAVRGMTKTAAIELGQYGIRVNSVHPGGVDTPMLGSSDFDNVDKDAAWASQPIQRIGRPEEIARMVLFLASDESSYSTGAEFVADGGRTAGHRDAGIGE